MNIAPGSVSRRQAVTSLAALTAAAMVPDAMAAAAMLIPIRIAGSPSDGSGAAFYAADLGFFRDAGFDPQIQLFNSGAAIATAVIAGDFDLGYANVLSLAQAHERELPVAMIFPASLYNGKAPATVFAVPNDSPIREPKDLDGKTLAIPGVGTLLQLAPMAWVDAHGGDSKSIKFIETPPPLIVPALESHRVDAGMITEPYVAQSAGKVRILAPGLDGVATTFISGGWFVNKAWAAAHPAIVANLVRVLARTARWANTHTRDSAIIIAKYLKLDPDIAAHMVRTPYPEQMQLDSVQRQIDIAAKYHFLKDAFPAIDLVYQAP